jgi:pyruvate, water dikinase
MKHTELIVKLNEVGINDIDTVGGKNASLGEMLQHLTNLGVQIPLGFVLTVCAYKRFISFNNLDEKITSLIHSIDVNNLASLREAR